MSNRRPNTLHVLAVALLVLVLPTSSSATEPLTASQILDRYVEAAGGYEAIDAITSLRRTGELTFESTFTGVLEGTIAMTLRPGERVHSKSELGAFTTTTAWDGTTAWEQGPQGFRILEGHELERLRTQSELLFAAELARSPGTAIERQADREIDGDAHYTLTIGDDDASRMTLYVDQEKGLVSQIVMPLQIPGIGDATAVMDLWDYRAHRGILLPDTVGFAVEGVFSTQMTFRETIMNEPVDEGLFAPPATDREQPSP